MQVMNQRGRLCVSVRAGRQGELPKGSVKVGASRTGATLYFEPTPLVELNNLESWLAGQEAEAEREVLRRLSRGVSEHSSALLKVCQTPHSALRARHASGCVVLCAKANLSVDFGC